MDVQAMSSNALRGYVKTLRMERGATQAEVADRIGMPLTTYKDWERGITKDIKTPYLVRAVLFLRGSLEQLGTFPDDATTEDGARLAQAWVVSALTPAPAETSEEASQITRLLELLAEGVPPDEAARRVQHGQ